MSCLKILLALVLMIGGISAQDSIFVTIDNDTVNIWNTGAFENCGFLVEMETIFSNDTITVIEHDTSTQYAFCNCNFDMCVSLTGLSPGNYHVDFFRTYDLINDPDSLYYIGSTDFTYNGTSSSVNEFYYQSDCYDITSIEVPEEIPEDFVILENYPNPFNPSTTIRFTLDSHSDVNLTVYDVLGKEITTLIQDNIVKGVHEIGFDGSNVSSGIYFCKIRISGNLTKTIKILLMK